MNKTESFKKAIENAKSAGLKNAAKKMKAVDFAAEFAKRGMNMDPGLEN